MCRAPVRTLPSLALHPRRHHSPANGSFSKHPAVSVTTLATPSPNTHTHTCVHARLQTEREASLRLKGENGIMRKKFNALQKDIEAQREEIKNHFEQRKVRVDTREGGGRVLALGGEVGG